MNWLPAVKDAYRPYSEQKMGEKRRLLQTVFSNCAWADGKQAPMYQRPFDSLVITNLVFRVNVEAEEEVSGFRPSWLPIVDVFRTFLTGDDISLADVDQLLSSATS